jgi:hypothetical protein
MQLSAAMAGVISTMQHVAIPSAIMHDCREKRVIFLVLVSSVSNPRSDAAWGTQLVLVYDLGCTFVKNARICFCALIHLGKTEYNERMKKGFIVWSVIAVVVAVGVIIAVYALQSRSSGEARTRISEAVYACKGGASIRAVYYEGPKKPQPAPGEMPIPSGRVDVSFNGAPTTTLAQTISADGARYATSDESTIFWSKGDGAFVMHHDTTDSQYVDCVVNH